MDKTAEKRQRNKLENRHKRFAERLGILESDERINVTKEALEKVKAKLAEHERYTLDAIRRAN